MAAAREARDDETGPLRTCVATRTVLPKDQLLRFVVGPDGAVVPDIRAKLPGRGVWVTATAVALADAIKRKALQRALKGEGRVPENLAADVERLLAADAVQALALANKAGLVTFGFAKVEAAIMAGRCNTLVHAADAAPDGLRKLRQAVSRRFGSPDAVPALSALSGEQMRLALGREVIHACLLAGAASNTFVTRCRRLMQYRTGKVESLGPDADRAASTGPLALIDGGTSPPTAGPETE